MAIGFSWGVAVRADLMPGLDDQPGSCSGKVSIEWPGTNQEVVMSYLANSLTRRGTPTSPAKQAA